MSETKRVAWCITGSGHYLKESIDILYGMENIDLFLSKAGEEVLKWYDYDLKIFKKMKKDEEPIEGVEFVKKADKIADALYTHENVVVGGTDFMWASGNLANSLDSIKLIFTEGFVF